MTTRRRRFVQSLSVIGAASLAGCTAGRRALDEFDIDDSPSTVQDTDGDGVIDSEDYAPRDPEVQQQSDLADPSSTSTPSATPNSQAIITEQFDDGSYTDTFTIREQDDETIEVQNGRLLHESPKNYNKGGTMLSGEFDATGTVQFQTNAKFDLTNYWGYGMGFWFDNARAWIKEQKWGEEDRLKAVVKGQNVTSEAVTVAPPTSSNTWQPYSLMVDFDDKQLLRVRRGEMTADISLDISEAYSDTVRVFIGGGRGHRVRHDHVSVTRES